MKAFPQKYPNDPGRPWNNLNNPVDCGMELRDYFAAKALESLIQNFLAKELDEVDPNGWMSGLATDAYTMADAMMEARK